MANLSPATLAINSIAQCLAAAAEAARGLDLAASQDLRSMLHIAACEAERVRKAARKASAPKKPAAKASKKSTKAERAMAPAAAPKQAKSRRKAAVAVNGAAAH